MAGTIEVIMVLFLKDSLSSDFIENENFIVFKFFLLNTGEDFHSCNVCLKMLGIKIRKIVEIKRKIKQLLVS